MRKFDPINPNVIFQDITCFSSVDDADYQRNDTFACGICDIIRVSFRFNSHTNFIYMYINDVIRTATSEGMRKVPSRNSTFWYISATRESTVCIHTCVRVLSGAPEREKQEGPSIVPWGRVFDFCWGAIPRVPLSCDVTFRPCRREIPAEFVVIRRDK